MASRRRATSTATSPTTRSAVSHGPAGSSASGTGTPPSASLTPKAVVDAIEHVIAVGGIETAALGSDYDGAVTVAWDTSNLAVITQELLDRGRSEAEIAAIMGGNTLRVLRAVLPTDPSQALPH